MPGRCGGAAWEARASTAAAEAFPSTVGRRERDETPVVADADPVTTLEQPIAGIPATATVVLVSSDAGLVEAVTAVAAEAGVEVVVAADLASAAPAWTEAPLVLVDATEAPDVPQLPSRRGVVIVTRTIADSDTWRSLVATGAEHIVELPLGAPWLFERLGRSLEVGREGRTGLVVVAGSAGGAGTSSLAAALASRAATRPGSPSDPGLLVDLDASGGGIDLVLGAERVPGARWDELAGISGPVDERVLLAALPQADGMAVLSWPSSGQVQPDGVAVGHVLDALTRLPQAPVVDAGRGRGALAQVALARADACVLVVPLRVRAVASARQQLRELSPHVEPLVVVRGPAPGGLTAGDVAEALGTDVVATLGHDRRRAVDEEVGSPAPHSQSWRRVCDALLAALEAAR